MRVLVCALLCGCVGVAAADECDPEVVASFWAAKKCEAGGYDRVIQRHMDAQERAYQELRGEVAARSRLSQQTAFLLERNAQLDRWETQVIGIEAQLSSGTGTAADIIQRLRALRDQLVARGELDLKVVNGELERRPGDRRLMRRKEIIEKVLNTLADIFIPSSPIDLIPLKKPWSTIRTVMQVLMAIKENWFAEAPGSGLRKSMGSETIDSPVITTWTNQYPERTT